MENAFYVYFLLREDDGLPFYVGKGVRKRWLSHEKASAAGEESHKARIIRKVIGQLGYLPKKKIAEGLTEEEAFALEVTLIAEIGRYPNGPLVNQTDGGEGGRGYRFSEQHCIATSIRVTEEWTDPAKRAKKIDGIILALADPEIRSKMSVAISAAFSTLEARAALSDRSNKIWADPKVKEKHHNSLVDMWEDPDIRDRAIAGMIAAWQDAEKSAARVQSMRDGWARRNADGVIPPEGGWYSDPDTKIRAVATMTETWRDPEKKAARLEKSRITRAATYGPPKPRKKRVTKDAAGFAEKIAAKWQDEEYRKEQTEKLTRIWEDPATVEKASNSAKDSWKDPEVKARRAQSMRDGWERRRTRLAAEAEAKTTD